MLLGRRKSEEAERKAVMAHGQGGETYPDVRHDGYWRADEPSFCYTFLPKEQTAMVLLVLTNRNVFLSAIESTN